MKFFYNSLELEAHDSVYYPREDSLLLAKVIENLHLRNKQILDMGCGSGFLSILLAKNNRVTAADIDEEAVKTTEENARKNKAEIRTIKSDLFSSVKERFDIIIFNPPYLPTEEGENDKIYSGGTSGRETIQKFINQARNHLNRDGKILLLISSLTSEKEVISLFEKNGFDAKVIAREKIPWEELVVIEANQMHL